MARHGIRFTRIWFDDDMDELQIEASQEGRVFVHTVYVDHGTLEKTLADLAGFKTGVHGGLIDIHFGAFGSEWANGAFHARLHHVKNRVHITCRMESRFFDFGKEEAADSATLHLVSEPGLIDRFAEELKLLRSGEAEEAFIEGV